MLERSQEPVTKPCPYLAYVATEHARGDRCHPPEETPLSRYCEWCIAEGSGPIYMPGGISVDRNYPMSVEKKIKEVDRVSQKRFEGCVRTTGGYTGIGKL